MSSLPSPAAPGPRGGQSTRQLLDELDQLMQRMLALPVSDDEAGGPATVSTLAPPVRQPAAGGPEPSESAPLPAGMSLRAYRVDADEIVHPPHPHGPPHGELRLTREQGPAAEPDQPTPAFGGAGSLLVGLTPPAEQPPASEETGPGEQAFAGMHAGPVAGRLAATPVPAQTFPAAARQSLWLLPLRAVNGIFDLFALCLGRPGRWLRSSAGRSVLGWLGLVLLAAAGALQVLTWIGWTW